MLKTFDKKSEKLKVKMMEGGVIVNNEQGKENIEELIEQTTNVMIKAKSRRDVGKDRTKHMGTMSEICNKQTRTTINITSWG